MICGGPTPTTTPGQPVRLAGVLPPKPIPGSPPDLCSAPTIRAGRFPWDPCATLSEAASRPTVSSVVGSGASRAATGTSSRPLTERATPTTTGSSISARPVRRRSRASAEAIPRRPADVRTARLAQVARGKHPVHGPTARRHVCLTRPTRTAPGGSLLPTQARASARAVVPPGATSRSPDLVPGTSLGLAERGRPARHGRRRSSPSRFAAAQFGLRHFGPSPVGLSLFSPIPGGACIAGPHRRSGPTPLTVRHRSVGQRARRFGAPGFQDRLRLQRQCRPRCLSEILSPISRQLIPASARRPSQAGAGARRDGLARTGLLVHGKRLDASPRRHGTVRRARRQAPSLRLPGPMRHWLPTRAHRALRPREFRRPCGPAARLPTPVRPSWHLRPRSARLPLRLSDRGAVRRPGAAGARCCSLLARLWSWA